jgi:hypothetical protein
MNSINHNEEYKKTLQNSPNPTNDIPRRTLSNSEAKGFISQLNKNGNFRFSELNPKETEDGLKSGLIIKLSDYKDQLKNKYLDELLNETFTDMPLLEEPMNFYQKGWENRTIYPRLRKHLNNMIKLNEFLDMYPPERKKMVVVEQNINSIKTARFKQLDKQTNDKNIRKEDFNKKISQKNKKTKENDELFRFKTKTKNKNDFAGLSFNLLTEAQPDSNEITSKVKNNKETREIIEKYSKGNENSVIYPREIHDQYQRDKLVEKTILVDEHSNFKIYF